MIKKIKPKQNLKGCFSVPGDKSISHRAVMIGAIASGDTEIHGFLPGEDCLSTISCFEKLGIQIDQEKDSVVVHGKGLHGLSAPSKMLDVGNSGTTMRLITGILAAQPFSSCLSGDASIQKRPMDRVAIPLSKMGAKITGAGYDKLFAPLLIEGNPLQAIHYTLPVASAQVKSAILLAGLYAEGETRIIEPEATRDHTEIMLNYFGAKMEQKGKEIVCSPNPTLTGKKIMVPGDISSAAYFLIAALICPNSEITLTGIGINPTRTGILTALEKMGANIELKNKRKQNGEPVADLTVHSMPLHGATIGGDLIPKLIDEVPILAVAACFAQGVTIIQNAEELKVKESNRIRTVVSELSKMGADIQETEDGMIITGGKPLCGVPVESYHDHRIAMSLAIAALACQGETEINNAQCVDISFPGFYDKIEEL